MTLSMTMTAIAGKIDWIRARPKWWIAVLGLSWLIVAGLVEFVHIPEDEILTINSPMVQQRLRDECSGTFEQRYDCKEAIIVEIGRQTFLHMTIRTAIVLIGPVAALIVFLTVFKSGRPEPASAPARFRESPPPCDAGARDGAAEESDETDGAEEPSLPMAWKRQAQDNIIQFLRQQEEPPASPAALDHEKPDHEKME